MKKYLIFLFCIWSFFANGQIRKSHRLTYDVENGKRKLYRCNIELYDKKGFLIKIIQKDYDKDGHFKYVMCTQNTYDTLGNLLKSIYHQKNSDGRKYYSIDTYTYVYTDEGFEQLGLNGKKIYYLDKNKKNYCIEGFNKEGILESKRIYEYDNKGRTLKDGFIYLNHPKSKEVTTFSYMDSLKQKAEHYERFIHDSLVATDYLFELSESSKPIKIKNLNDNSVTVSTYDKNDNIVNSKTFNVNNELIYETKRKIKYWH